MVWPDTLALSPDGGFDMYATANRLPYYFNELLTEDTGPNFRWVIGREGQLQCVRKNTFFIFRTRILRMDTGGDAPYLVEDD